VKKYTTQWVPTPTQGTSTDDGEFFGTIVHDQNWRSDSWVVRIFKHDGVRYESADYEEFDDLIRAEMWLEGVLWALERDL